MCVRVYVCVRTDRAHIILSIPNYSVSIITLKGLEDNQHKVLTPCLLSFVPLTANCFRALIVGIQPTTLTVAQAVMDGWMDG